MGGSKRSRTPSAKCLEAVSNLEAKKRKSSPKPKLTRGTTLAALVSKTEPKLRPVSRTKAKASNKKASPKARKKAAKKEEEPVLTLFYWDGRGLMEVARQMLAHSVSFFPHKSPPSQLSQVFRLLLSGKNGRGGLCRLSFGLHRH